MRRLETMTTREITFGGAIALAILEEMARDKDVIVIGEDCWRALEEDQMHPKYARKPHPQVFNTPISEAGFIGTATGAAMMGLRPVIYFLQGMFMFSGFDQVVNQIPKLRYLSGGQARLPIVIYTSDCVGMRFAAQHAWSLHPMFAGVPGFKIVLPSTPYDAKGLMKTAIRDDSPVLFLSHFLLEGTKGTVPEGEYTIDFGKADIKRPGKDVTIVAISYMVDKAMRAARRLERQGIDAEVLDPRTVVPLDKEAIFSSVEKTGHLVVVDDAHKTCSLASEISATVAEERFNCLKAPPKRLAIADVPVPFSPVLEDEIVPTERKIIDAVKSVLNR
jgi:pyruvate/2-oxoglutarate/acetoin dehydrogenase E1 component